MAITAVGTASTAARTGRGGTLEPFEFGQKLEDYRDKPLTDVLRLIQDELKGYRNKRFKYFNDLRRKESHWANGARKLLALLGTVAVILAAVSSATNLLAKDNWLVIHQVPLGAAIGGLVIYALIGAISFYEKASDATSAYFRHLAITASIRDLWTKLEFALLKIVLDTPKVEADTSMEVRRQLHTVAGAFVADLNRITSDEFTEWRTDFVASLAEIEEAARSGRGVAERTLEAGIAEAKATADKALKAAAEAEQASRPATLNLAIAGQFEGEVGILVDGQEVARTHLRSYPVIGLRPGERKIEAKAKKGDTALAYAKVIAVQPGTQDVKIDLA